MNLNTLETINEFTAEVSGKARNFGGKRRMGDSIPKSNQSNLKKIPSWFTALSTSMQAATPSALVVVNNQSASESDRKFIDQQLASIASLTSRITQETVAGREPRVVYDEVGYPPFTFSRIQEFRRGANVILTNSWFEEGMPTLTGKFIKPPTQDSDRRAAILYGAGPLEQLEIVESSFLRMFNPSHFCKSFGPDLGDGIVHFYVQWSILPEELSDALGANPDSDEVGQVMDILEEHSRRRHVVPDLMRRTNQ
jgi:hypothetical protein